MGIYTEAIQKLYVAYFNRPADAAGLAYWENIVANGKGSTAAISAAFATSTEYKAAYAGMDEYHVVAQVYQNLFGRAPELSGLNFWGQALINKQMTVDNVVTMIAAGAQGTDLAAYNAKVSAATAFTNALDTSDKVLAYSGDKANGVAKSFLAGVVDATTLANAISTATLGQVISDVVAAAPQQVGVTYTLTAGLDALVGTAGNDVFNVLAINPTTGQPQNNLSAFDTIDGSAGKDTLNIQIQTVNTGTAAAPVNTTYNSLSGLTAGSIKNIETINITADAASVGTVDASVFQGATQINQIGQAGAVTKLAAGTTAGFTGFAGGSSAAYSTLNVGAAGASAAVAFTNVGEFTNLTVGGSKLASVSVSGSRADTDASGSIAGMTLTANIGLDVQSVSVNTNQKTTLVINEDVTSAKHVSTVDASASTGGITFDATSMTNVANVKTGAGADVVTIATVTNAGSSTVAAVTASVSTGAGNDTIYINATADSTNGGNLVTVDAGAGNDKIYIAKVAGVGLNVNGGEGNDTVTLSGAALETTDVIDGGAGSNTIAMAGAASRVAGDYIMFNKELKNFSTIKFTSTESALDASQLAANYTTIDLAAGSVVTGVGSQAVVAHGALTATATGYSVASSGTVTYGGTLNVSESATSSLTAKTDVLNLTVKAASTDYAGTGATGGVTTTLAGDMQSAIVTLSSTVDNGDTPAQDEVAAVSITTTASGATTPSLSALKSVTLSGSGSATVTNNGGKLVTVDASALTGQSIDATIKGLTYVSTNASAETIKLGSGIDSVQLGASTYGKVDTVVGLHLVLNTAGTALAASSDLLKVDSIAASTAIKVMTTTQTDLDLALTDAVHAGSNVVFTMGGDTYVFHDAGGTAGAANGVIDAADTVVKLAGVTDVKAVIIALGGTVL